jgi:hypothetical protein
MHVVDFIAEQHVLAARDLWSRDEITIHSANAAGRAQMARTIELLRGRAAPRAPDCDPNGEPRFGFSSKLARA